MSKRLLVLCLCLSAALYLGQAARAEEKEEQKEAPPSKRDTVEFNDSSLGFLNLSLADTVVMALKNNLDVEVARLDPLIEDKNISVEKAPFDPIFSATGDVRDVTEPINSAFVTGTAPGKLSRQIKTVDASLSILTPIGATAEIDYNFERTFRSTRAGVFFNPAVNSSIEAKITQPLLKKFGIFYTRSKIYMARNDKRRSLYAFEKTAIDITNEVQRAYWNLVNAIEELRVAHMSLSRAQAFLKDNELKVQAGILAPVDIIVDQEEVSFREEEIILKERDVLDREDELKRLLYFLGPNTAPWLADITIIPTDKPFFEVRDVDLNNAVKVALENRPDLFEQKLILDNAGIETRRKRNELLPQLDFEGGVRLRGLDNHWGDSQQEWMTGDFREEFARLTFEIPIGLRKGRAEYAKAKYEKRKELLELDKLEQDIIFEVREAVRRLNTTRKMIRQTSTTLKLANRRLVGEEKKYSVGRTTNIEVLRAQNDLALQEARAIKAMTEHYIAQGELEAVKGTILEKFNIVLEGQALGNEFIY